MKKELKELIKNKKFSDDQILKILNEYKPQEEEDTDIMNENDTESESSGDSNDQNEADSDSATENPAKGGITKDLLKKLLKEIEEDEKKPAQKPLKTTLFSQKPLLCVNTSPNVDYAMFSVYLGEKYLYLFL